MCTLELLKVLIIQDIFHLSATVIENNQLPRNVSRLPGSTGMRLAIYATAGLLGFEPRLSYLPAVTLVHSPIAHIYSAFSENSAPQTRETK